MVNQLTNQAFTDYFVQYSKKKEKDPNQQLYSINTGVLLVTNQTPNQAKKISIETLMTDIKGRGRLTPLQKINIANALLKLHQLEKPSMLQKTFKKMTSEKKANQAAKSNFFTKAFQKITPESQTKKVHQLVETLVNSAESEAASRIQKVYRKHNVQRKAASCIQKAYRKYKADKEKRVASYRDQRENPQTRETFLKKIVRVFWQIINSFVNLFRSMKEKAPSEIELLEKARSLSQTENLSIQETNSIQEESHADTIKEKIQKINNDYLILFDTLGQKEGHPTVQSCNFDGSTLILNHDKTTNLEVNYIANVKMTIPERLELKYEMNSNSEAVVTLLSPVPVKFKLPLMKEKTYHVDKFVLQENHFVVHMSNDKDQQSFEVSSGRIKAIAEKLQWIKAAE